MRSYDLAVLGLGAMGAMAAWRAAGRDANVLAVEQFGPAHDRGSSHGGSRIFRRTLFEGVEYVPLVDRARELWQRLEADTGRSLFRGSGGLCIGARDGELIADALRSAEAGGFDHELLEPDELAVRYPQHATVDGDVAIFEPGAGVLDPEASIKAALDLAADAGADLRFDTTVTGLRHEDGRVRIELGDEIAYADKVIVATGAWFTDLVPELALPLRVQRSPLVWFTGQDREAYTHQRFPVFVRDSGDGLDGWGIPDVDGTGVKVGVGPTPLKPYLAHASDNDYPIDERDTTPPEEYCRWGLPGLRPTAVAAKPCMNSKTPDGDFVLGVPASAPRLVLAGGFSGHGFKHATGVGDIAVELALDGGTAVALDRFSPDRFAGVTR